MNFIIEDRASQGRNQQVWVSDSASGTTVYQGASPDNSVNLSKANIASFTFKYGIAGNDAKLYANGVLVASGETNAAAFSSANSNSTMYIGADYQLTYPLNGYIAEVIIFKRQLSDFERTEIEKYLSKKWNIKLG